MNDEAHPRRIGLIGDPVEHSLSPSFQQPAFDASGLSIRYELWHTPLNDLPRRLNDIREGRALGANVTVPHKEATFALMDDVSDVARRAGAVNTVVMRDGRLTGDNTDVHGFTVPLQERDFPFSVARAVVLGAGGAARGVVVALLDAGIGEITIVNRTESRAEAIAFALEDERIRTVGLDQLSEAATGAMLLVNATALGWTTDTLPDQDLTLSRMDGHGLAYDLTYRDTPFLAAARSANRRTIDGLAMLVHQGARSFEIWTGIPAPVDLMWASAVEARAKRSG